MKLPPREKEKFICRSLRVRSPSKKVRKNSLEAWSSISIEPETKLMSAVELNGLEHW